MISHATHIKEKAANATLGFWLYLMTDIMIFASLFATFVILRDGTNGGPSGRELFNLEFVMAETFLLLVSSFTCGLAYLAIKHGQKRRTLMLLGTTITLGIGFLSLELYEFGELYLAGHDWTHSAFLSAFFTLVGTHGLHILIGIIWAIALGDYISKRGTTPDAVRKFSLFALFWHFLDLVWIFIFTVVYLLGAIS